MPSVEATRRFFRYGAIAQLGERLHGMQEVSGSIPLSSTKPRPTVCVEKTVSRCGGIAQLGERLHGMQEVSGSIPLISTNSLFVPNTRNMSSIPNPFFPATIAGETLRPAFAARYRVSSITRGLSAGVGDDIAETREKAC